MASSIIGSQAVETLYEEMQLNLKSIHIFKVIISVHMYATSWKKEYKKVIINEQGIGIGDP